jgi:hypothetical protein
VARAVVSKTAILPVSVKAVEQALRVVRPAEVDALQGFPFSFTSYFCDMAKDEMRDDARDEMRDDARSASICGAIQVVSRNYGDLSLLSKKFHKG